ncbi:GHKL domain-containing protein [Periweissella cryptocerci]|uniref:GHKL domain-containing protein n=1 Tax=Periweissella cryptocerci TaxID=2506420 RepID=A0A4P6YR23_9LACO|nr:GHKL domain-containing protein [Periweissella cryptocerci]QBO35068.1 GHKL domain-containing protein [Periweissella cryptocerci]
MATTTSLQSLVEEIISVWSFIILTYWFLPELTKIKTLTKFNIAMAIFLPLAEGNYLWADLFYVSVVALIIWRRSASYQKLIINFSIIWMIWELTPIYGDWLTAHVFFPAQAKQQYLSWLALLTDDLLTLMFFVVAAVLIRKVLSKPLNSFDNFSDKYKASMLKLFAFMSVVFFLIANIYLKITSDQYTNIVMLALTAFTVISIWMYHFFFRAYEDSLQQQIEKSNYQFLQEYNQLLVEANNHARAFKHDTNNLLSGIEAYIDENDMDGLRVYINQILKLNNQRLEPDHVATMLKNIQSLALRHTLITKLRKAQDLGTQIHLVADPDFILTLTDVDMVRVVSILLDNAIEAVADHPEESHINITLTSNEHENQLVIKNSIFEHVDIEHVYESGHTTKENHTGLGLHTVQAIVHKHPNVFFGVEATDSYFQVTLTSRKD